MHRQPLSGILSPYQEKEAIKKYGFTIVELIVTISIIAILGTIAFMSLQGYSSSARDSTRISDLSAMKTSLELFHLDTGKYPETTAGFAVTYSGTEVWTQGIFGETTKINVEKLDKIPKDPLSEKEYTYSLTKTKQEYELAGLIEGDLVYIPPAEGIIALLNQTNAEEIIATAIVTGNYNGVLFKVETGTTCEVLSVPSIISSQGDSQTNLIEILEDKNLVYTGYNNLPSNYKGSKYKTDDGFEFESKNLVVYSDNQECKPLYDGENPVARINLIKNLQTAYSGTIIENSEKIRGFIDLDTTDINTINTLSITLVNNNLGGKLLQQKQKTQIVSCTGLPANSIYNGTTSITQIWNGSSWLPSNTVVYNNTSSTTECRFKCNVGYAHQNGQCNFILPECAVGYTYNTVIDKCESNPACASGYIYDISTKLCQKLESTSVSPTGNCSVSISIYQYGNNGTVSPGGTVQLYHYNSQSGGAIYSKTKFDNNCRITSVASIRYGEWDTAVVSYAPGQGTTSQVPYTSISRVSNTTSVGCPGGYTVSGTTCTRTLTATSTCGNGGTLNTSVNKCQLDATCSIGLLNTSLDACVEN